MSTALAKLIEEAREQSAEAESEVTRPITRGECVRGIRPCPWISCRAHLLEVLDEHGRIKFASDEEVIARLEAMAESCSLDVADRGGATGDEVGAALEITRSRVGQLENSALYKMSRRAQPLAVFADAETVPRRTRPGRLADPNRVRRPRPARAYSFGKRPRRKHPDDR